MMIRRPALALLLLALPLLGACGDDAEAPAPTSRSTGSGASAVAGAQGEYVDRDGFAITFPEDWQVRPDAAGLQVVAALPGATPGGFTNNVGVLLEDTGVGDLSLERYLDASVTNAPKLIMDFREIDSGTRKGADGQDQGFFEYTGTAQGQDLHFLAVVALEQGKAFVATYTATEQSFAGGRPAAERVLASLRTT